MFRMWQVLLNESKSCSTPKGSHGKKAIFLLRM
ncbi:unnamed protein product [Staurois parvus]|uniref:Uncharacterized protein n=1 Tax=Staurois parvus TaxID=386267 RepID=A0ABN9FVQ1_9NEOB|nr:unnamed protein product [Staurois parvus]